MSSFGPSTTFIFFIRMSQRTGAPCMYAGSMSCVDERPEPDLSAESTPTGGWCQMKQASIFTENFLEFYQNFTNSISRKYDEISDNFDYSNFAFTIHQCLSQVPSFVTVTHKIFIHSSSTVQCD